MFKWRTEEKDTQQSHPSAKLPMPANYSPSFAKNIMRRSLAAVLDPHPTKSQLCLLIDHFGESCAYCGKRIHVYAKDAQLDHIISGGPNNISNRLYSCEDCNEKEKRDEDWRTFLRKKTSDDETYRSRAERIEAWLAAHTAAYIALDEASQLELEQHINAAVARFEQSLCAIRAMRPSKDGQAKP